MSSVTRYALIEGSFEAIHCWPKAPDSEEYLRFPHRHLFVVVVQIEVKHADREIEYYNFKTWLEALLVCMPKPLQQSCEQYCDFIAEQVNKAYPKRRLVIKVLEDGHEGALCEYNFSR